MAAVDNAHGVKCFGQRAKTARHRLGMAFGVFNGKRHFFGRFTYLARPGGKIGGGKPCHMQTFGQMVIEHHIAHAKPFDRRNQPRGFADQMGFSPDLHPHVGQRAGAVQIKRRQEVFRVVWSAHAAFPAPALGQKRGCHAVGRRFPIKRRKPRRKGKRRTGARRHMAFKPVAVQINNARQHQIAGQINLGQRAARNASICKTDRAALQLCVPQNLGASQTELGQ